MKHAKLAIVAAAAAFLMGSSAFASGEELKMIDLDAWSSSGDGGPFEVDPSNFGFVPGGTGLYGAASGNFITFCLERDEFVNTTDTYDVKFTSAADNGGVAGGDPDPLDERSAFLYTAFVNGTLHAKLAGFTYGNAASGEALQEAFWVIEEELDLADVSALAQDLVDLADDAVDVGGEWVGKGLGSVRVMNLTLNGYARQDQLVMIPLPIPAALGLAGLVGVGGISIRRRRQAAGV